MLFRSHATTLLVDSENEWFCVPPIALLCLEGAERLRSEYGRSAEIRSPISCDTHGLNVVVSVHQNGLLLGIVADLSKDHWGKRELLAIHHVRTQVRKSGLDTQPLQLVIEPARHLDDICAIRGIRADTVLKMMSTQIERTREGKAALTSEWRPLRRVCR